MPARLGLSGLLARDSAHLTRSAAATPPPPPMFAPVRCAEGRVYAARTVWREDARRYDSARERAERWL